MKSLFSRLLLLSFLALGGIIQPSALEAKSKSYSKKHKMGSKSPEGSWTPLTNQPTFMHGAGSPLLLTDGSVLVTDNVLAIPADPNGAVNGYPDIWKLTPDQSGSYVNGTWSQLASFPVISGSIVGSINGTVLTITDLSQLGLAVLSSTFIFVSGPDVAAGTQIVGFIGFNADGSVSFEVSIPQKIASQQLIVSAQFAPAAPASAVLADGRVVVAGGENNNIGDFSTSTWQALCAIYDPVSDTWTPFAPPLSFGNSIGDASSAVLNDGTLMIANSLTSQAALLDAKTLTWTETGTATKNDNNNEEGWTLLPDGKVLTIDVATTTSALVTTVYKDGTPGVGPFIAFISSSAFALPITYPIVAEGAVASPDITACTPLTPGSMTGKIGVNIRNGTCDSSVYPNIMAAAGAIASLTIFDIASSFSAPGATIFNATIGPEGQALIDAINNQNPNNPLLITINAAGSAPGALNSEVYDPKTGTWSSAGSTKVLLVDPSTAEIGPAVLRSNGTVFATGGTGNNAIYDTKSGTWSAGPSFPNIPGEGQLSIMDGPGALLPNGNVLVATSPGFFVPPVHIFEFDGKALHEQPATPNAPVISSVHCTMLVLPTGQILMTDKSTDIEIFTPGNKKYNPNWAPLVTKAPSKVQPGGSYKIKGIRFNGMSQGAMFGDNFQMATNYPIVRITNCETGHVFYSRTHDHSFMGVASDKKVHTFFDVPANQELGRSKLEVVANGIPSKPIFVEVVAPCPVK